MPLHKITDIDASYRFSDRDIMGFNIYNGSEIIGSVDDVLVNDAGEIQYIVMFMGRFLAGKRVLLPFNLAQIFHDDRRLHADELSQAQLEALPEYTRTTVIDQDYEDQVDQAYRSSTVGSATAPVMLGTTTPVSAAAPMDLGSATIADVDATNAHNMSGMNAINTGSASMVDVDATPVGTSAIGVDTTTFGSTNVVDTNQVIDMDVVTPSTADLATQEQRNIELYEERLVADKVREKTGEVAIGKRVETETTRVSVPIEKERIIVEEDTSIDTETAVVPGEGAFQAGEVARMEVYEETPEIHKEAFVREQVNVRKEVDRDVAEVDDEIRREELDIRTEGNAPIEQHSDLISD